MRCLLCLTQTLHNGNEYAFFLVQYLERADVDSVTDLPCYRFTKLWNIVTYFESPVLFLVNLKSSSGATTGDTSRLLYCPWSVDYM